MRNICLILLLFTIVQNVSAQALTNSEKEYLSKSAIDINVDETYQNGDWSAVLKDIGDKRIVALGEFTHGAGELFTARNDLIKALHRQKGFNLILFEAGIGEMVAVNSGKDTLSPAQMTEGLFGPWRTREFRELMAFIKQNNLEIGGFDVQRTGRTFRRTLQKNLIENKLDTTKYSNIEERFEDAHRLVSNRKSVHDSIEPKIREVMLDYLKLISELTYLTDPNDPSQLQLYLTLHNRYDYLNYKLKFVKDKDWRSRWKSRDSLMAQNMELLLDKIFPNEKVIVIGHNFHLSRFNEKEEVMGEFLKEKYGEQMYILGAFSGSGSYHSNSGDEKQMEEPDPERLDIKHVIRELDGRIHFLPVPKNGSKKYAWLFRKITINDSFTDLNSSNQLQLSRHFDGLLLLDKVSPPSK